MTADIDDAREIVRRHARGAALSAAAFEESVHVDWASGEVFDPTLNAVAALGAELLDPTANLTDHQTLKRAIVTLACLDLAYFRDHDGRWPS